MSVTAESNLPVLTMTCQESLLLEIGVLQKMKFALC